MADRKFVYSTPSYNHRVTVEVNLKAKRAVVRCRVERRFTKWKTLKLFNHYEYVTSQSDVVMYHDGDIMKTVARLMEEGLIQAEAVEEERRRLEDGGLVLYRSPDITVETR